MKGGEKGNFQVLPCPLELLIKDPQTRKEQKDGLSQFLKPVAKMA